MTTAVTAVVKIMTVMVVRWASGGGGYGNGNDNIALAVATVRMVIITTLRVVGAAENSGGGCGIFSKG